MKLTDFKDDKYFFSLVLSVVFLTAALYLSDTGEVLNRLYSADLTFLFIGFILGNIPIILAAYSWKIVFERGGIQESLRSMIFLKFSCVFLSNLTPLGDVGGEPVVAKLISERYNQSYSSVLSRIAVVDTVQNIPYVFFGISNLFLIGLNTNKLIIGSFLNSISGFTSVFLAPVLLSEKLNSFLEGFHRVLKKYVDLMKELLQEPEYGLKLVTISILSFFFDFMCVLAVTRSLGVDVSIWVLFLVVPVARIANLIPSIGGLGAYEAGFAGLLALTSSASMAEGLSISILYRIITAYFGILAGLLMINRAGLLKFYKSVVCKI